MKILALVLFMYIYSRNTEAIYIPIIRNPYARHDWPSSHSDTGNENAGTGVVDAETNVLNLQKKPSVNYQQVNVDLDTRTVTDEAGRIYKPQKYVQPVENGNRALVQFSPLAGAGRSFSLLGPNDNKEPCNDIIPPNLGPPDVAGRNDDTMGPSNGKEMALHLRSRRETKSVNMNVKHRTVREPQTTRRPSNGNKKTSHLSREEESEAVNMNVKNDTVKDGVQRGLIFEGNNNTEFFNGNKMAVEIHPQKGTSLDINVTASSTATGAARMFNSPGLSGNSMVLTLFPEE